MLLDLLTKEEETLKKYLRQVELAKEITLLLDRARRSDENPLSTLKRLLEERRAIVDLFDDLKLTRDPFDSGYKSSWWRALKHIRGMQEELDKLKGAPERTDPVRVGEIYIEHHVMLDDSVRYRLMKALPHNDASPVGTSIYLLLTDVLQAAADRGLLWIWEQDLDGRWSQHDLLPYKGDSK